MPSARTSLLAAIATLLLGPLLPGCAPTCPKDKLDCGADFVRDLCALEPLASTIELRPGAVWASVDLPPAPLGHGMRIFLYRDGAELDGRPLDLATLRDEVDKAQEIAGLQGKPWGGGVVLAIAADVTVRTILPILDMLEETGFTDITFVAQARGGPEIPQLPAPEVTAELDARAAAMPAGAHLPASPRGANSSTSRPPAAPSSPSPARPHDLYPTTSAASASATPSSPPATPVDAQRTSCAPSASP